MRESRDGKLLRIFIDEDDRFEGRPLHVAIVDELRAAGFTGATVLRGIEGYGPSGHLRSLRADDHAGSMPLVIEAIEDEAKVQAVLPRIEAMIRGGLVTLETLRLVRLGKDSE